MSVNDKASSELYRVEVSVFKFAFMCLICNNFVMLVGRLVSVTC